MIKRKMFPGLIKSSVLLTIFSVILFFSSCEKDPLLPTELDQQTTGDPEMNEFLTCHPQGRLIDYELVNSMTAEQIKTTLGPAFASLVRNGVEMYKVSYLTNFNRRLKIVSGIIGIPDTVIDENTPIVMYNHGTRLNEADLPPSSGMDLLTVAAAANGKICLAADYIGYGDTKHIFPPYMIKAATIRPVCDMIVASRHFLRRNYGIYKKPHITMFGYSQGGSVTMAVQRVLENNPRYRHLVNLKGVACGTGPYDLYHNTMIPILQSDSYSGQAFMLFIFTSFNKYYCINEDLDNIFKNSYGQLFLELRSQNKTFDEVNSALPESNEELFQEEFRTNFLNGCTAFNIYFKRNATFKNWKPKSPTRLYHSVDDEIVPYANAETAYNAFINAGATSVDLITYQNFDHVTTAFVSFVDIMQWAEE